MALPTPSQTVGPYFHIGLPTEGRAEVVAPDAQGSIRLEGVVLDGEDRPVPDALIEIWQANRAGRYAHPEDTREDLPLEDGFTGFGRCATDAEGGYRFQTIKPGAVPAPGGRMQAPHVAISVLGRGLLKRLATRIYFPDEQEANAADPVLATVPAERRATLLAKPTDDGYRFDIRLQGTGETVFFAL